MGGVWGLTLRPHLKLSTTRECGLPFGPGHDEEVCTELCVPQTPEGPRGPQSKGPQHWEA